MIVQGCEECDSGGYFETDEQTDKFIYQHWFATGHQLIKGSYGVGH